MNKAIVEYHHAPVEDIKKIAITSKKAQLEFYCESVKIVDTYESQGLIMMFTTMPGNYTITFTIRFPAMMVEFEKPAFIRPQAVVPA